jgi:hypothetical protein
VEGTTLILGNIPTLARWTKEDHEKIQNNFIRGKDLNLTPPKYEVRGYVINYLIIS